MLGMLRVIWELRDMWPGSRCNLSMKVQELSLLKVGIPIVLL